MTIGRAWGYRYQRDEKLAQSFAGKFGGSGRGGQRYGRGEYYALWLAGDKFMRVGGLTINADFEVQVGAGRNAGSAL
jgi:hypothetical protein